MDSTYPITNDGTLTNICGQRKSNHVILRPHGLKMHLDLRTYHENLCFRGHEKWVQVFFFFKRSVHTIITFDEVYTGCECNQLSVNFTSNFFAMTLTSCGA